MIYTGLHQRKRHGFTLIEALFYISVLILISLTAIDVLLDLNRIFVSNKADRILTETTSTALERMLYEIRAASDVDTGLSVLGSSPGTLVLDNGTSSVSFTLSGGTINVTENGISKGAFTSDAITIQSLVFRRYTGPESEMIRIALTASAVSGPASSTRTYYGSAVFRESYE